MLRPISEAEKLADSLARLTEIRGADDPLVQRVPAGQSPGKRALSLLRDTELDRVEVRRDLDTPFNFFSTLDITGENSGSRVVNRDGRLVELIFDGNVESLELDFVYEDTVARAISVDIRAKLEALEKVYQATDLLDEITRGQA